jgi:hypothetical protein
MSRLGSRRRRSATPLWLAGTTEAKVPCLPSAGVGTDEIDTAK